MAEAGDLYVDDYGHSLFERVLAAYDLWLERLPCINQSTAGVEGRSRQQLVRDVYPAVRQLCIRLEAAGKGELSSRIERDFRDVEDYARLIDNYCESDKFNLNLWLYGDLVQDRIAQVNEPPAALLERARALERPVTDDDFQGWFLVREWTLDLGERCEQSEIEKYGHAAMPGYARHVAYWAWACFWLAVQLRHQGIDHGQASGWLEGYLSSMMAVTETKNPVIHEALGRAYGMSIYPLEPMESEEVRRAFENFVSAVTETQEALTATARDAAASAAGLAAASVDETPVAPVTFVKDPSRRDDIISAGDPSTLLDSGQAAVPALTPDDMAIMRTLAGAKTTQQQAEIAAAAERDIKTVRERLKRLEAVGLVSRPCGERSGFAITPAGLKLLNSADH